MVLASDCRRSFQFLKIHLSQLRISALFKREDGGERALPSQHCAEYRVGRSGETIEPYARTGRQAPREVLPIVSQLSADS